MKVALALCLLGLKAAQAVACVGGVGNLEAETWEDLIIWGRVRTTDRRRSLG